MTDWTPTGRLRFVKRGGHWVTASPHDQTAVRVGAVNILQQEWRKEIMAARPKRHGYYPFAKSSLEMGAYVAGVETEWRDVPVEAE